MPGSETASQWNAAGTARCFLGAPLRQVRFGIDRADVHLTLVLAHRLPADKVSFRPKQLLDLPCYPGRILGAPPVDPCHGLFLPFLRFFIRRLGGVQIEDRIFR